MYVSIDNKIHTTFNRARVFLPVIHCQDEVQVASCIEVARACGADGAWLINQGGMEPAEIAQIAVDNTRNDPDFWLGVNLLGTSLAGAVSAARTLPGLWRDDAGITITRAGIVGATEDLILRALRLRTAWKGLLFGGVAFKYQPRTVPPAFYGAVASAAADAGIDVVTTSGPATGHPPDVAKIIAMREAIGDRALAIASGISEDNVERFLPYTDGFIVSSSIESTPGIFDPSRVTRLAKKIHAFQP